MKILELRTLLLITVSLIFIITLITGVNIVVSAIQPKPVIKVSSSKPVIITSKAAVSDFIDSSKSESSNIAQSSKSSSSKNISSSVISSNNISSAKSSVISSSSVSSDTTADQRPNLFSDFGFKKGFKLYGTSDSSPTASTPIGILNLGNSANTDPLWTIGQWDTRYNILGVKPVLGTDGSVDYTNEGKTIKLFNENGSVLRLAVNGINEWVNPWRDKSKEDWPTLLLGQDIQNWQSELKVSRCSSIDFSMDVRINECKLLVDSSDPRFNAISQCGQTTAYFVVQNRTQGNPDYGKYIWLGVPIFDSRYTFPSQFNLIDSNHGGATNMIIWVMGGNDFLTNNYSSNPSEFGKWATCKVNMVQQISAALITAHNSGCLKNTNMEDLYVTSFNIGWEVPGPYSTSMDIRNLSIKSTPK